MVIEIKGLSKKYGKKTVLDNIDIHVDKGSIYGFLGQNGAGKTTTMNILCRLLNYESGLCLINGYDIRKTKDITKLKIGYLPEEARYYEYMSAFEYLSYIQMTRNEKNIFNLLEKVGLENEGEKRIQYYSRGMKQRLGIASAIINDPEIILLDEPTSALDPQGRIDFSDIVKDLKNSGKTIFLSTHILSDVEKMCEKVGILHNGKMMMEKRVEDMNREFASKDYVVGIEDIDEKVIDKFLKSNLFESININKDKNEIECKIKKESRKNEIYNFLGNFDNNVLYVNKYISDLEKIFIKHTSSQNGGGDSE